ncbi:hypothetical protein FKG94_25840 [Exilibacterium tricleocarpae]|uniref:Uncharacterized protein n=1 Tax=Exilibacterium tricleocarpae TaxID=2591008 RepID=A0A545SR30_9GAMM|nr:hypothetical protein [Exilibacterium tricleocarpae]TQV67346.1 hypothetical protein FKG94_25840 [Exilibacterium tricleocarpae]
MAIKKTLIAITIISLLLCLGYVYIRFSDKTVGAGFSEQSPNGKYVAQVFEKRIISKFSNSRHWSELRIKDNEGNLIWRATIENDDRYFQWRGGGEIVWQEDSNRAIFIYKQGENTILRYMSKAIE